MIMPVIPMRVASDSYWLIGTLAFYTLAFRLGMGAVGIWLGLNVGLAAAWISMAWRFWAYKSKI